MACFDNLEKAEKQNKTKKSENVDRGLFQNFKPHTYSQRTNLFFSVLVVTCYIETKDKYQV